MTLRSPSAAVAWEIWSRNWAGLLSVAGLLVMGAVLLPALRHSSRWASYTHSVAYALTAVALVGTLACFHFTEGSRKGGFGSYPLRLFHLPVNTWVLVALPMLHGAVALVLVYLLCAGLLLRHAGLDLPLLWPCLYLVFGLTQFQMIVWSLPGSRYLKLLCLSMAASILALGWMFFIPSIVAGALSEWGYAGDPAVFLHGWLGALALAGPAAYGISLFRLRQQRHGLRTPFAGCSPGWEQFIGRWWHRRTPFRSADHALVWLEWRRLGLTLPIVVAVVVALTCVPAWLSGGLSGRATVGILNWLITAPFLLAILLGRGWGKPDFWSPDLRIAPFPAIRPVTPGQWVFAKLKVAWVSAALTWGLVLYLGFIWIAFAGDLHGPEVWLRRIRFYYSPQERGLLSILVLPVVVTGTWRCLVGGLTVGCSGSRLWYHTLNLLVGAGMVALLVMVIRNSDGASDQLRLYHLWPVIAWLPVILTSAVVVKMAVAVFSWGKALQRGMVSQRMAIRYFAGWFFLVAMVAVFLFILSRNTLWLRHLMMLVAVLLVPLAGPALAMHALAANRSRA